MLYKQIHINTNPLKFSKSYSVLKKACFGSLSPRHKHFLAYSPSCIWQNRMSTFHLIQTLNNKSREMEWKVVEEDYDYHLEIASSCYGDMLHDDERNKKFGLALKKAIEKVKGRGKEAHVLDIGTGTGLLSMLAARYGAASVVACEMFLPVANCAERIIERNGFSERIKLVRKHSTSLTVGPNGDLPRKANILVSEVFDTELIGEGAISTFNHAHQHLLEDDAIVIPSEGVIYGQVVKSDAILRFNKLESWRVQGANGEVIVDVPTNIVNCRGPPALHDLQLSQLPQTEFTALSDKFPIFRFDFMRSQVIPNCEQNITKTKAINSGTPHAVFMWWDLIMDDEGDITLSCAPVWHHPDGRNDAPSGNPAIGIPWRDHWMQAVYILPSSDSLSKGDQFSIRSNHDEFSLWFQIGEEIDSGPPVCHCSFHLQACRTRIGALNDPRRRKEYAAALKSTIIGKTLIVFLGDFSLLGLLAAKLGVKVHILVKTSSPLVFNTYKNFIEHNKLSDVVTLHSNVKSIASVIAEFAEINRNIGKEICIVGEPFFQASLLAWDNCYFWNLKEDLLEALPSSINREDINVFPEKVTIKACATEFDDLWKIARPLKSCMTLDLTLFDELIIEAKSKAQISPEPQPLWEYPCKARGPPVILLELDLRKPLPLKTIQLLTSIPHSNGDSLDSVTVWTEYQLNERHKICTGPEQAVTNGEYIKWDRYERQGVHLLTYPQRGTESSALTTQISFDPKSTEFNFKFVFRGEKYKS